MNPPCKVGAVRCARSLVNVGHTVPQTASSSVPTQPYTTGLLQDICQQVQITIREGKSKRVVSAFPHTWELVPVTGSFPGSDSADYTCTIYTRLEQKNRIALPLELTPGVWVLMAAFELRVLKKLVVACCVAPLVDHNFDSAPSILPSATFCKGIGVLDRLLSYRLNQRDLQSRAMCAGTCSGIQCQ